MIFTDPITAHGAFARFVGQIVLGNHIPRASMDAVFAADTSVVVDDHGTFFILGDGFRGAHRRAHGELAMQTTVSSPQGREALQP